MIFAGRKGGFGSNLVRVRHPNGFITGYAHLSRMDVRRGQRVKQGRANRKSWNHRAFPQVPISIIGSRTEADNMSILRNLQLYPRTKESRRNIFNQFVLFRDELMERLASIPEVEPSLSRTFRTD